LRFALWPSARGAGLAMEGASAALHYGHDQAGLPRIIAVAREDNFGSRMVLGAIGMAETDRFLRDGITLIVSESVRYQNAR
jgi:RimJ/RimL family protein N-acetyltransferase